MRRAWISFLCLAAFAWIVPGQVAVAPPATALGTCSPNSAETLPVSDVYCINGRAMASRNWIRPACLKSIPPAFVYTYHEHECGNKGIGAEYIAQARAIRYLSNRDGVT